MRVRLPAILLGVLLIPAVLLSSCSTQGSSSGGGSGAGSSSDGAASAASSAAETTVAAGPAVSFRVTGEDGSQVSGADVYLVSSSLDREIRAVTGEDGTADPDGIDAGTWFVRVSANGFRTSETLVDLKDGANSVDISLAARIQLPQYLMSYTYRTSADGPALIGLAGSEDGIVFRAFPGWEAVEGEGGGIVILDGYLCVYTNQSVVRYDLDTGTREAPQLFSVYSEAGLQNAEQACFGALMRDVRFFEDPAEGLVAIGGEMDNQYDYLDFFEESILNKTISVAGWQTPLPDAGGLLFLRPAETRIVSRFVNDIPDCDTSYVLLPAPDGGRYMIMTTATGLRLLHGPALGGEFVPTEAIPDTYMYTGDIAGVTGFYDDAKSCYTLYGVLSASEKQLYTASLSSFDEPFDPREGLVKVDMGFLDPGAVSFANPVILDTGNVSDGASTELGNASGAAGADSADSGNASGTAGGRSGDLTLGFGENEYLFYPMTSANSGVISYNSMQEGGTCTAEISSDMTLVTVCDSYTPSSFAVSGRAPAGSNIASAGLVYAWSPSGMLPGGFAFTVSEGGWRLSALVPSILAGLAAGGEITSDTTLLEGAFAGDPGNAVLSIFFRDGHHILMIDGTVVGEYDTPADTGILQAGYVGLIATSGSDAGGATFTYEAPKLLVR